MIGRALRVLAYAVACAIALEALYRGFLFWSQPQHFALSSFSQSFTVWDKPMWRYDSRYGYDYIPEQTITRTAITHGRVSQCITSVDTNAQGNIGPAVPDYEEAELRVALFGDSFTAMALDGMTWPNLLQGQLEHATGHKVRILNLARDGYGVLQMFDFAAARIPEIKPNLMLFAFNSTALQRGRSWRRLIGQGNEARFVTTTSPDSVTSGTDVILLAPAASLAWCEAMRQRGDQQGDPTLAQLIARARHSRSRGAQADAFDFRTSYVLDLLTRGDAFASQWDRLPPGTNPKVDYTDYGDDPQFVRAVQSAAASGVPYLIVHLPMGVSLRDHQEFWLEPGAAPLLKSLEIVTGHPVIGMRPHISIAPQHAMQLCLGLSDCHPSRLGMEAYAKAATRIIMENLAQ